MFGPEITALDRRQIGFSQIWWQIVRWNVGTEWTESNIAQIIPERVTGDGRQRQRCTRIQNVVQAVPTWEATTVNWKPYVRNDETEEIKCIKSMGHATLPQNGIATKSTAAKMYTKNIEYARTCATWIWLKVEKKNNIQTSVARVQLNRYIVPHRTPVINRCHLTRRDVVALAFSVWSIYRYSIEMILKQFKKMWIMYKQQFDA